MRVELSNFGVITISMTVRELIENGSLDSLKDLTRKIPLSVLMEVVKEKMVELEKLETENTQTDGVLMTTTKPSGGIKTNAFDMRM